MAIELWASFFVFLLAETVVFYKHRWAIYLAITTFLFVPYYTDKFNLTDYSVHFKKGMTLQYGLVMYLPLFLIGVIFSDIEHLSKGFGRPLDALRNINFWVKIPINLVFIVIFMFYGSLLGEGKC